MGTMVNVECPGCSAPYNVSEKRIPATGLKMRCPKCGESFVVNKPGGEAAPGGAPPGPPRPRGTTPRQTAMAAPPNSKPLFRQKAPSSQQAPRKAKATAIAGSLNIPALAEIGSSAEDDGFGVLDMSLPGDGLGGGAADAPDDLPIAADHADLPMPAAQADLPVPAHVNRGGPPMPADAELPMPATAGLPNVMHGADLPVPVMGADLPMPAHYHDLPVPAAHADLPVPAAHGDLPVPAAHGDLPVPAAHGDLPAPAAHGDLPAPAAHGDLPMPAEYGDLPFPGDGDLPAPAGGADLPMPHFHGDLPVPNDQDLPLPSAGGDLPLPADQDFPLPAPNGDLPLPADFNLPQSAHGDLPLAIDQDFPAAIGADQDFGAGSQFPGGEGAFGDVASEPPRGQLPPRREGAGVGDEFAIDEGDESGFASEGTAEEGLDGQRIPLRRKKRTQGLRIAIAAMGALALGGGLLSFTSLGPYGAYAISDMLNGDSYVSGLASFRQAAQDQLDTDTASNAMALFARAKNEQAQMPRYSPMAGYAAYLAFQGILRFGPDPATLASARQILAANNPTGDMGALARAALAAVDGNFPQAQTQLNPILQRLSDDIDVQVLAAELTLRTGKPEAAVAAWTLAVTTRKGARTLYGLARAQLRAGDVEGAKKSAEEAMKLSKHHAGARIVLATILWRVSRTDENAMKMLSEVTAAGPVKASASKTEQVDALSLVGTIHLSLARMTEAEKAFKAALQIDHKSVRALVGNGELLYSAGRYSEALARFKAARELSPKNLQAIVGNAKTLIKLERAKDARTELLALAKTTKHPLVGYWLGQSQEALADRKAAEQTYLRTIKAAPLNRETVVVYVALADIIGARGDTAGADALLDEATEKLKESAELHNAKGDVALKGGRVAEAKTEFMRALELEPGNSKSRFKLAVAYRRARNLDAAMSELDKLAKADPNFPGLMLEQGLLLQLMGKGDEAMKIYTKALEDAPNDLDLMLRVGLTQVLSGRPAKAKILLSQVYNKRPRSAEVNHYLGRAVLMAESDASAAMAHLKLAATLDGSRAEYQLWVAIAANKMRDWATAEKSIQKALAIDRNYADAYWQQGVTLQEQGKTKDALEILLIALKKNPTLHQAQATIARCYQDQTKYDLAEQAWRKAIEGDTNVAEWHFRLAKLLVNRSATEQALAHLERSIELLEKEQKPGWLWNANWLLAEGLRTTKPVRSLKAYKAFIKLTNSENAYRQDAETAVRALEKQLREKEHGGTASP